MKIFSLNLEFFRESGALESGFAESRNCGELLSKSAARDTSARRVQVSMPFISADPKTPGLSFRLATVVYLVFHDRCNFHSLSECEL